MAIGMVNSMKKEVRARRRSNQFFHVSTCEEERRARGRGRKIKQEQEGDLAMAIITQDES